MLILKIGRTSLKTSLTKVTKSVFSATCYIPALRRAVLPSIDFIMCTDFPHWGFTSAPLAPSNFPPWGWKRDKETRCPDTDDEVCGARWSSGNVVIMTSQYPYYYSTLVSCPGPDDEVRCLIVLGKVVVVVLVRISQYPSYSCSALVQASMKCPMVLGGWKTQDPYTAIDWIAGPWFIFSQRPPLLPLSKFNWPRTLYVSACDEICYRFFLCLRVFMFCLCVLVSLCLWPSTFLSVIKAWFWW